MGNDIFNYGSYAIDKNTLLRTLQHEDNIRDYSRYKSYTPEEDSEFRNIVQYLHSGIQNGTISGDGFGNFTDIAQNPYKNNRTYGEALNYVHRVANEIGNTKVKPKQNSTEKFNVGKHSFQSYFLNQLDPFNSDEKYDQSVKDYLEQYKDDEVGKVQDFVTKLENYQTKYNNFSGIDFGEFGLTSEQYNDSLNKLKEGLKDGIVDTSDKVLANNLGIGNIINVLFDNRLNTPKQSNKFDVSKHGFKNYFAKSISSPFSTGDSYTTDLQDYIQGYSDQNNRIKDFTNRITAWQKSNNNFNGLDFSQYGLTPEQFNEGLENLKKALSDGQIDYNDKMLAKNLGLLDVVNDVFGQSSNFSQSQDNQEFKNELFEQNWTINNEGKWVMPNGAVTKFKQEENPVEKIAQMAKKEYKIDSHLQNPESVSWWNSISSSDQKRMWSLLCDIISVIDPEPFTAAGLGYTSDYLTHQADKLDGDVSWGRTALNVGLSTLGAVPIVGDIALGSRITKNLGKVTKALGLMVSIPSVAILFSNFPELKKSWSNFIHGEASVDDYRNVYNIFTVVFGTGNAARTQVGKMKANKHLVDSEQGLAITVNRNGKNEKIVFKSQEEINAVKNIKDPEELKKYLKDNYEGFDDVKIQDVKTTKNTEFSFKDREHWYSSPFKRTTTTEINPTEVGIVKNKYSKYSLARSKYLEKRYGKFLSEQDAVVPTKKQPGQTSETAPETSSTEFIIPGEPAITELPKPDPVNIPETTQVANTPASRIEPDVEINTKPTRIESAVSEKSFNSLRSRIRLSSLEVSDAIGAEINLNILEKQIKNAGKKAAKKARDVYSKKKGVKPSAPYLQALEDLKKTGMTEKQARTVLRDLNAFKSGGVIRAQTGIKFPAGFSVTEINRYFNYNPSTGNYDLKEGVNIDEVNTWLKGYGLSYNPGSYYGRSTNYTSTYDNGAISTDYKGANNDLRDTRLKVTSDTSKELDLNAHLAKYGMYKGDQASNRNADIINYYNSNNFENLNQFIDTYNNSIEAMYSFKRTPQGTTYDPNGNDSVRAFNQSHRNIYKSHNDLYGYDEDSEHINGSATMARGIDITDQDILIDTSSDENLTKLLGNAKLYKGKNGLLYYKEDSSLENIRSMRTDSKDKPEDVMPKKPRNYDFSQLLDLGQYFHALNTNKKLYELGNEVQPLLYDPKEDHRYIVGDLDAKLLGQKQAAEKNRFARNIANSTSDASLGAAVQLEAFRQGQNDILEGNRADNEAIKESTEKAWEQEVQNHENRYNIAMKNRENMYQINREKLLNKANYIRANHDSTTNYINKLAIDMKKKHQEISNIRDFYYKQQLQGYAKRNPSQFVDGWSKYDSDVWSKGESGVQLDATEQIRYDQLRELVQQGYYNVLAKQNGVIVNTPHTGWLYSAEPRIKVIKEE